MFLYLVQHAEAKKEEEDPERGLTDKGFREIARTALFAQDRGVRISVIRHSGKKRALQTARTLANYLKPELGIVQDDGLSPVDDPGIWAGRLAQERDDVLFVGHLPHLARFASLLLCGNRERNCIDFTMAGIVCLRRFDDGHWSVAWMITPAMTG